MTPDVGPAASSLAAMTPDGRPAASPRSVTTPDGGPAASSLPPTTPADGAAEGAAHAPAAGEATAPAPAAANAPTAGRDFRLLWTGQSVSLLGDQFILVALPLMAVATLGVSAAQAALLPFAMKLPFLLLGLPAGAILDRMPRRPVMILSEAVQAGCYLLIAALAAAEALPFGLLMLLVAVSGCATVFFQVAYTSYLPSFLREPRALHRANARLQLSESVSRSLGPAMAGPLIAAAGPVGAVFANSGSFAVSAGTLFGIRHREPRPEAAEPDRGWLRREIREGVGFVFGHPILEPILMCGAVYVLFQGIVMTIIVLYCLEVLGLSEAAIGLVVGASALGYPTGNLLSARVADRIGPLRTIVLGAATSATGFVLMPISGSAGFVVGLVAASVVHGIGEGMFGPTWTTIRQTVTPPTLLGRVNSVERFLLWGVVPLASLAASGLISWIGLSGAMWVGALGTVACLPPLLRRGVAAGVRGGSVEAWS
ncbi:MAG TPA: MFS transporter [Acidimicrobiales bacterium]